MSKGILEFNIPEEELEFKRSINGSKYHCYLEEFYNESIRKRIKYDTNISSLELKLLEKIKDEFNELFSNLLWEE